MDELTEAYYIAGQNTIADVESESYIRAVQYAVLNFLADLSDRSTAQVMDDYVTIIEGGLLDSSSLLSFAPKTIQAYVWHFFNTPVMRELILHTWQTVATIVNPIQVKSVHGRIIAAATTLVNGDKTMSGWLDVEVIEMMRGDYPQQHELETALKELPWLFIPFMIANYCDFYRIERIIAKRMTERATIGTSASRSSSTKAKP